MATAAVVMRSPPASISGPAALFSGRHLAARRLSLGLRCSAESTPSSSAAVTDDPSASAATSGGVSDRTVVGSEPTGVRPPYSLISSENVKKALRGIAITDADHYGRLGIDKKASYNEVKAAYESKCAELSNKGLEEEEVNKELELLKESFAILSTIEERRIYDWSLARSERPERYVWPYETDDLPMPSNPPPQEPEDVGPTRLVGYFFLAWVILSFVLSLTLNNSALF